MSLLTYDSYLGVRALVSLQQPLTGPPNSGRMGAAEHHFIVVHQAQELLATQCLIDLDHVGQRLRSGQSTVALEHLGRASSIMAHLVSDLDLLENLPPDCFGELRNHLGTASGAQSANFRELNREISAHPAAGTAYGGLLDELNRRGITPPTLWDEPEAVDPELRRLGDGFLQLGQRFWQWKVNHLAHVARFIDTASGTGGTDGVSHLVRRLQLPFAELRAAAGLVSRPGTVRQPVGDRIQNV